MKAKRFAIVFALILMLATVTVLTACSNEQGNQNGTATTVTCYLYGTTQSPETYEAEDGILHLSSIPTRMGYSFSGLYDAPTGGSMVMDAQGNCTVVFDHAMTVYAHWTALEYSIEFDCKGGELSSDTSEMTVTYDSLLSKLPTATREGFTFIGWADENGKLYSDGASVDPELQAFNTDHYSFDGDTVRLYAVYEVKKYTVIFDYNDGTYRTKNITIEHGKTIPEDQYPTDGLDTGTRRVADWALSSDGVQPFPGTVKDNITLYAVWKEYRTYALNDTVGNETNIYVYKDETFDLQNYDGVIRPGYQLDGWYTSGTYAGNPVTEIPYGSPNKIYYAKWSVATYTLVFDQNSAGKIIDHITYQMGDTVEFETITREGLTFRGWSHIPDGTGEVFTTLPPTFWGNHTLYAIYEPAYFDLILWTDGGTLPAGKSVITVEYTKPYELPFPEKTGFVFKGWYDSAEPNAKRLTDDKGKSLAPYGLISESTAYARWTPLTYTVTFNTNGGNSIPSQTVNHGDKPTLPADPTLDGKVFSGWFSDSELTTRVSQTLRVTSNITLYAKWVESTPISSAADMKLIAANPDGSFHLTKDINLGGEEWVPIAEFRGTLDGRGHTVYNYTISSSNAGFIFTNRGTIQNLTISDFNMTLTGGELIIGGLVGSNSAGTIYNCHAKDGVMTITARGDRDGTNWAVYIGGLCGYSNGIVDSCSSEVSMSAGITAYNPTKWNGNYMSYTILFGGLVGESAGTIRNCTARSQAYAGVYAVGIAGPGGYGSTAECFTDVGGIVGRNKGTCENCVSEGVAAIRSFSHGFQGKLHGYVGGFVGRNMGKIQFCSSKATAELVPGQLSGGGVGGFAGYNAETVMNSYATGAVTTQGMPAGGFVGLNTNNITNCYSLSTLKTSTAGAPRGGFVGTNGTGGNINKCFAAGEMEGGTTAGTASFMTASQTGNSCFKCYYRTEMAVTANDVSSAPAILNGEAVSTSRVKTEAFVYETLAWASDIWRIPADGYPVLIWED